MSVSDGYTAGYLITDESWMYNVKWKQIPEDYIHYNIFITLKNKQIWVKYYLAIYE